MVARLNRLERLMGAEAAADAKPAHRQTHAE